MSDVRLECIKVFADVMNVDAGVINDNTNPETLQEWDSLAHVQLVQALERAFNITIPPDEGIELESFPMVVDFVTKKLAA